MADDSGAVAIAVSPEDVDIVLPGSLHGAGYDMPPALSFDQWVRAGVTLQQMHASINWWIGDWILYGQAHFPEESYQAVREHAMEITGRSEGSIAQAAWVAERFPPERRKDPEVIPWAGHREVLLADLPPDEVTALIEEAAEEKARGLTVTTRDLGERARARKDEIAQDTPYQLAAPADRSAIAATKNGSESEEAAPEPSPSDVQAPDEMFTDVVDIDVQLERVADLAADFAELLAAMMSRVRGEVNHFPACRIGKSVDGYGPPNGAPCSDSCALARKLLNRYAELYPDDVSMDDDEGES